MYKAAQCAVVKKQDTQQMSGNSNEVLNTICPELKLKIRIKAMKIMAVVF